MRRLCLPWAKVVDYQSLTKSVAGQVAASCTQPTEDVPPVASKLLEPSSYLLQLLVVLLSSGRVLKHLSEKLMWRPQDLTPYRG